MEQEESKRMREAANILAKKIMHIRPSTVQESGKTREELISDEIFSLGKVMSLLHNAQLDEVRQGLELMRQEAFRFMLENDELRAQNKAIRTAAAKREIEFSRLLEMIKKTHPLMKACGWHVATDRATSEDGVLELAVSLAEKEFSDTIAQYASLKKDDM